MNYEAWALEMCTLLDRIEAVCDDAEAVHDLCQDRFEIARKHGMTVVFEGPTTGYDQ